MELSQNTSTVKQVLILGSTGSIGLSTLDVIAQHPDKYQVFGLVAQSSLDLMLAQCLRYSPKYAFLQNATSRQQLRHKLKEQNSAVEVPESESELDQLCAHPDVNYVMAAIVGAAGLKPTLAAVRAGKRVLLANKESLVTAGNLFMKEVAAAGAELLPIDSEHNAIFQCLPATYRGQPATCGVKKILLTASGGPFRETPIEQLATVTPAQAVAHPNWSMGRKISVDSASLMNKGLELIEACWLFNVSPSFVEVVIHPESVIHSMVEYVDGSVIAQLGSPDMRTPIAYGLAWPSRIEASVTPLDFVKLGQLRFESPDLLRFPCLRLAAEAFDVGGSACATLNAANEVAVDAFLNGNLRFSQIPSLIEQVLQEIEVVAIGSIDEVFQADRIARLETQNRLAEFL